MAETNKKVMTAEQIYKRNKFRSKLFKIFAPIIFWVFIALTILFTILMIENSVGNITEIINMLDKNTHTGQELEDNYAYLVGKYGEWNIVGQSSSVFSVSFVNIKAAFFSGLMITFLILAIVCLVIAIVVGKVLFPKLAQYYTDNNQDMANVATLRTNEEVMKMKQKEKEDKEWF